MAYINSRGELVDKKSLSWSTPIDFILAIINFICIFFQTLLPIGSNSSGSTNSRSNRNDRWGGGGGGGGGKPGGRGGPRGGPNIRTLGSCGGPNAPPAAGG